MNKILIIVGIVALILISGCGSGGMNPVAVNHPDCSKGIVINMCCVDCEDLGKDFYKRNKGLGYSECWCKENNKTIRIW